jgi:hypothetical protein
MDTRNQKEMSDVYPSPKASIPTPRDRSENDSTQAASVKILNPLSGSINL